MADLHRQQMPLDLTSCQSILENAARLEAGNNYSELLVELDRLVNIVEPHSDSPLGTEEAYMVLLSYAYRAMIHARFLSTPSEHNTQSPVISDALKYSARDDLLTALSVDPHLLVSADPNVLIGVVHSYEHMAEAGKCISMKELESSPDRRQEGLDAVIQAYENLIYLLRDALMHVEAPKVELESKLFQALINHSEAVKESAALALPVDGTLANEQYSKSLLSMSDSLDLLLSNTQLYTNGSPESEQDRNRTIGRIMVSMVGQARAISDLTRYNLDDQDPYLFDNWRNNSLLLAELDMRDFELFQTYDAPLFQQWLIAAKKVLDFLRSDMKYLDGLQVDERCFVEFMGAWLNHQLGNKDLAVDYCNAVAEFAYLNSNRIVPLTEFESDAHQRIQKNVRKYLAQANKLRQDITDSGSSGELVEA